MPFGISRAPEVFQRINMSIFGDIDGVNIIFDDLIVAAENILERDRSLSDVFSKAFKNGVRFNIDKIQYSVKYTGHIVTNQSVSADPENIIAIRDNSISSRPKTSRHRQNGKISTQLCLLARYWQRHRKIRVVLWRLLKLSKFSKEKDSCLTTSLIGHGRKLESTYLL